MLEEVAASSSPAPVAPASPDFVCDCREWMRSACAGERFYQEHEGKRYCVLHFPGAEKSAAFAEALRRKLDAKDFDFKGVWFPDALDFSNYTFSAEADFRSATFSAAADFSHALFKDEVIFAGDEKSRGFTEQSFLVLVNARVEKPERVSFHTLVLRPHWFINVDARKFDFTNVEWSDLKRRDGIKRVLKEVEGSELNSLNNLLARACRHLAVNAEENHRYEEAAQFRYWAMDVRRQERWRGLAFWKLSWWYWVASGYGERILQAFLVLVGVWFVFALLYTRVGFARPPNTLPDESSATSAKGIEFNELRELPSALTYSFSVMTLQKPEPQPETVEAKALVAVETVLGPLQAALLALAVRRKFMR